MVRSFGKENHYQETPEDVAQRIRVCLEHVPADRLYINPDCGNPDCGFRRVARWIARRKLESMVAGTAIVRGEIGA